MTESLSQSLAEIRKLTPNLNKVTDDAALVVASVETMLAQTGVGTSAYVNAGHVTNRDLTLSYQRHAGRFRIMVEAYFIHLDENDNEQTVKDWEKPWTDCSRSEKLCSFNALPELLKKIVEEEKQAIQEMDSASQTIKAVMAAITT